VNPIFLNRLKSSWYRKILAVPILLIISSCIETFEPVTQTFEEILVVEAIITDELRKQQILLSKTTPLENNEIEPETDAIVQVTDNVSNVYSFSESAPGVYVSNSEFRAEAGREYALSIETSEGESYKSGNATLTGTGQIEEIRAQRITNENGTDGVAIRADGSGFDSNSVFFRYEYEETYQIIPPFVINLDLVVVSENPPLLDTIVKTREERVCYNTIGSKSIILSSANNLSENEVENIQVRFIARDNPILKSRYSILVKQFVHSQQAYSYYETLSRISDLESVFSQLQPGFVEGNIQATENANKNVIGIFDVASVSNKRIFFNFRDIFQDGNNPPYFVSCKPDTDFVTTIPSPNPTEFSRIQRLLNQGYKLISYEEGFFGGISSFTIVPPACGNCTVLGSNIEPEFWED
jgi:hypothetical protein